MCGFSRSNFSLLRVASVSVSSFASVKATEEVVPFDAVLCRGLTHRPSLLGHYGKRLHTSTRLELGARQGILIVRVLLIAGWYL